MITLVSILKSGEYRINSRIDNAGINSSVSGKMDKTIVLITLVLIVVRGRTDEQSY